MTFNKFLLFIGMPLLLVGCTSNPIVAPSLKLYTFECGKLNYDSIESFGIADSETDVRDLIVPCYIIEHEKGRLLWEGGLPSSLAKNDEAQEMDGGWRMQLNATFASQIAPIGLTMSNFDYMSFSHFHFDHVGIANEIEGATLIIQKPEYDAAFAEDVVIPGFSPPLYSKLIESKKIIIDGDHDVFGDGSVRLISAPGHTPGHQVLYLDLPNYGPVILAGDLYHFRLSRELRRVPSYNIDSVLSLESIDKIEALVIETGAKLWIEHELAGFEKIAKSPEYID